MTEVFVKNLGVIIICLIAVILLRNFGFKGVPVLISVVMVGATSAYAGALGGVFSDLYGALGQGGEEYVAAAARLVGVGYLSGVVSDVCRENGENGLASAVSSVGRLEMLLITLPYIGRIIAIVAEGI
jgi:hypothetical protein